MLNCSKPCDNYCPCCGRRHRDRWIPTPRPRPWPWYEEHRPWYVEPNVGNPYNPTRPWPGRTLEVWS